MIDKYFWEISYNGKFSSFSCWNRKKDVKDTNDGRKDENA